MAAFWRSFERARRFGISDLETPGERLTIEFTEGAAAGEEIFLAIGAIMAPSPRHRR